MKRLANNQAIQRNMLYRLFLYGKILLFTVQKVEKVKGIEDASENRKTCYSTYNRERLEKHQNDLGKFQYF